MFKLAEEQAIVLDCLKRSPLRNVFYWTGGTALAYCYLRHRFSYDIDLFSDDPFTYQDILPFVRGLAKAGRFKKIDEKRVFDRWEFFLHNKRMVRVDFAYYPFKNLRPRKRWGGLRVDALEDIAADKAMAVVDRHEPKDAFDLYFLLKRGRFTLKKLARGVERKFGVKLDELTLASHALVGSKSLREIRPLLAGGKAENDKLIGEIAAYFGKESSRILKNRL